MNIYTILMSKEKCETFFPKLGTSKDIIRSKRSKKNTLAHLPKRGNSSLGEERYRITCHDILSTPTPGFQSKPKDKIINEKSFRATFLKNSEQPKFGLKLPQSINEYTKTKELGKGGFAEVFQAESQEGHIVAMKKYQLDHSLNCFKNQYSIGSHFFEGGVIRQKFANFKGAKHIIGFVERIRKGKVGYIVQQVGGKSLSKMLSDVQGVFHKGQRVYEVQFTSFHHSLRNKKNLVQLIKQIAEGIKLLNDEGFVHCDLKPENILVSCEPINSKIIDFGSSFEREKGLPKITITPEYMPPQLLLTLESDGSVSYALDRIDVWSLGCILLQIVTGIPLWFRYKCKLEIRGRECLQLGFFALTNREYSKIVRRQKELCANIKSIPFVSEEFQFTRNILKRILVFEEAQRATIDETLDILTSIAI